MFFDWVVMLLKFRGWRLAWLIRDVWGEESVEGIAGRCLSRPHSALFPFVGHASICAEPRGPIENIEDEAGCRLVAFRDFPNQRARGNGALRRCARIG